MYEFPPMAARVAILICLYLFLVAAYRELYRAVRETRPHRSSLPSKADGHVLPTLTLLKSACGDVLGGEAVALLSANVLGRATDNEIVLPDPAVSSYHARIDFDRDRFVLADLGSTNGTFLNDEPVTKPTVLRAGDYIRLGESVLVFRAG